MFKQSSSITDSAGKRASSPVKYFTQNEGFTQAEKCEFSFMHHMNETNEGAILPKGIFRLNIYKINSSISYRNFVYW